MLTPAMTMMGTRLLERGGGGRGGNGEEVGMHHLGRVSPKLGVGC